ncbi:MAG: 50S ribosomal protein L18 [Parcubacteria group bacterium]|nr:50S ribosomal protein L18 [Parcubacteria group bacterium]
MLKKQIKKQRRHKRVRAKISGTVAVPRFCVTRTNTHIYAQLIDDEKGHTIVTAGDKGIKKGNKTEIAVEVGKLIAEKAKEKKIGKVVFDRGGYKYHGRIKAVAEGAREGGLKF